MMLFNVRLTVGLRRLILVSLMSLFVVACVVCRCACRLFLKVRGQVRLMFVRRLLFVVLVRVLGLMVSARFRLVVGVFTRPRVALMFGMLLVRWLIIMLRCCRKRRVRRRLGLGRRPRLVLRRVRRPCCRLLGLLALLVLVRFPWVLLALVVRFVLRCRFCGIGWWRCEVTDTLSSIVVSSGVSAVSSSISPGGGGLASVMFSSSHAAGACDLYAVTGILVVVAVANVVAGSSV